MGHLPPTYLVTPRRTIISRKEPRGLVPRRDPDCYDRVSERACIGAWNASGMISIIQMNVRIELGDHKHYPAHSCRFTGGSQRAPKLYQRYIARAIFSLSLSLSLPPPFFSLSLFRSNSEPFSDEHGNESFRPARREFNFAGESLLDGNDGQSAIEIEGRALFLPQKGMSSLGPRRSLIPARMSDKKKRQVETSRSTVIEKPIEKFSEVYYEPMQ